MDSLRFRQIASNLISNAIKFTPQGSVLVQLLIEPEDNRARVRLRVQDTGVGLDERQRERLFQPYTQFDSGQPELQIGTGLGLSICQQLTQLMGGRLSCVSEPGHGSCFTLELEAALAPDEEAAPLIDAVHLPPLPMRTVLIVEDHEFNRVVLQRQLESLGMRVTCAENGIDGLQRWEREPFDYVITDCNMPQMSGDQMTRQLRVTEAREGRAATHVVGLTANAQPEEIQRCLEAGMNDCLFKPVTRPVLERYLHQAERTKQATSPCFDISKIRDITAGDAAMTRQLLATVLRTNQEDFDAMQALYTAGDFNAVGRRCHKILGSARIIHARPLICACKQLEQGCHEDLPPDELNRLHLAFVAHMQCLQNSLRAHLDSPAL